MFTKLRPVFLVAGRELQDQFRDWRVVAPMVVLVLGFPFLMNAFAGQTVKFLNQYGANLVINQLVPASIMIIGFFPITVSLVVALESFVGEKERGTIEPMLSSPLDNWQMYFGKLLVGVATPLITSFLSIGLYLILAYRMGLKLPSGLVMFQLMCLTVAHAFLMVSAAIVISVQSTSVKAANLLASFVVIPVAILMQGEASMLFWGTEDVLWLAVVGVTIIALLLIRLGISHFQREYLLGREIDTFNIGWAWRYFWAEFSGGARSPLQWYLQTVPAVFKRIAPAVALLLATAIISLWMSYDFAMNNLSRVFAAASPDDLSRLAERIRRMPDMRMFRENFTTSFLFFNNTRAMIVISLLGSVSFGVLGVILYMANVGLIGGLFGVFQLLGMEAAGLFAYGVLPHGIFELPALIIGSAAVLYVGANIVTPQVGRSMGEVLISLLADWAKVFLGLVIPLLGIAALIEANITPLLLERFLQ